MFQKETLCIDIGSQNIKIVVGNQKGKKVLVKKISIIPTPVGTFEDGNILNVHNLAEKISKALAVEKINIKKASCTSSSTGMIIREIIIPPAEEKDLDTIVKFEIAQYLPIVINDYVMNHRIIGKVIEGDTEKLKMQVVAYPRTMAAGYFHLLQALRLTPVALDIHSNSIYKLFRESIQINQEGYAIEETVAIVDMGASYLNLSIIGNGVNEFNRIITSGGNAIDGYIEKELHIAKEQAEKRKWEECNFDSVNSGFSSDLVNQGIKFNVEGWIEEITRIFQYYKNRNVGNEIRCLYLYGGTSNLKGIEPYMSIRLGMPVIKIKSMSNVEFDKNLEVEDIGQCLNAIGAIIRL